MATESCQQTIHETWKLGYYASKLKLALAALTFVGVPFLIEFNPVLPHTCRCPPGILFPTSKLPSHECVVGL